MIKIIQTRQQIGRGHLFDFGGPIERPPEEALGQLVKAELNWGGKITELTPTKVKVETYILGKIDVSVFEGNEEEMKPIYERALAYQKERAQ